MSKTGLALLLAMLLTGCGGGLRGDASAGPNPGGGFYGAPNIDIGRRFPDLAHDDEVDACSGALEMLNPQMKSWGLYELYRQQAEAAAERSKPQPVQTVPAPGSMEWLEAQKKKG